MTPARRQILVWLAAILAIALTVSLGCWQLRRAAFKHQAQAAWQAQGQLPAWSNADWPCDVHHDPAALPAHRPVLLSGQWMPEYTVFLDNRPMDGLSGFIVVTPLRLAGSGACPHGIVLIQRGWVPRDPRDRLHLPVIPTPQGLVQLAGRVAPRLSQVYQLGDEPIDPGSARPVVRQNTDAAFWARWLRQSPLAGAVLQAEAESVSKASADTLLRHWSEPGLGEDRHRAYAAQWFAMAAVLAGLTLWFLVIRPRRLRRHHVHS